MHNGDEGTHGSVDQQSLHAHGHNFGALHPLVKTAISTRMGSTSGWLSKQIRHSDHALNRLQRQTAKHVKKLMKQTKPQTLPKVTRKNQQKTLGLAKSFNRVFKLPQTPKGLK